MPATIDVKDAAGSTVTLKTIESLVGEVQASPTSNTLLDRLKAIATALGLTATAAKQPALGTAGTASADVITVQGIAAGTPIATGGKTAFAAVTFSLDTSAYASGDLLADTQAVASVFRVNDGTGVLQSITLNDKDAQGVAMSIFILDTTTSLGTENSAPSISDANLDNVLHVIPVLTTDWVTVSGAKVASLRNLGLPIKAVSGAATLGIALLNGTGAPTFTASGITARLGILQD